MNEDNESETDEDNEERAGVSNEPRSHRSQMAAKVDSDNLQYEDPMVNELKQTEVLFVCFCRDYPL